MATPSVLARLGDKASRYVSGIKTLTPEDSEIQSLKANQEQADALAGQPRLRPIVKEETNVPMAQPTDATRYGSREGEKRFAVDPSGNLTEIPMEKPQHVDHYTMTVPVASSPETPRMKPIIPESLSQPMRAPVFDDGGDVAVKQQQAADAALSAGASRDVAPPPALPAIPQYTHGNDPGRAHASKGSGDVKQTEYMPGGGPEAEAPGMPTIPVDMSKAPVYDEGGDVDVNDGKHTTAVLEDGERVLTPEENDQFKKEHPEEAAAHAQPTQEASLRPFSEVKAEKEKAQAPQPALKTIDSHSTEEGQPLQEKPAPEQLPTASHEERVAIKKDQQDAMGQGVNGLTQLGMANIHAKQLGLKGETMDAAPGAVEDKTTAPAAFGGAPSSPSGPGLKPIQEPAPAPAVTSEQGGDFKTRLAQLKLDHAKALAERTPDGKVKADYIQEQINDLHKNNPWGTEGNHPGILGKLGHVAAKVGNIAGDIAAPSTMALIPGTDLNKRFQEHQLQAQTAQDQAAVAAQDKADKTSAKTGPATTEQIQDYQTRVKASGLADSPDTKALSTYLNVPPGTTAAELDKRLEEATKVKSMDVAQQNATTAERERQDKARQAQANYETTRNDKLSKAYYTYTTTDPKTGKKTTQVTTGDKLDELPEDAQLLPVKDMSALVGEARSMNAVQDSMNELHKDLHDHPEVFDNAAARSIIQTTTEQMNRVAATMLVAGTGGSLPLPSGLGDMINTALQNNALDPKEAKAVKSYIADYKAMKDKAMIIQMAMQNGKMGRGGMQIFDSIVSQLPGGSTPDGATALRQMSSIQRTLNGLTSKYPDKYADFTKTEPYALAETAPEGTAAAERTAPEHKAATKPATKTTNGYSSNNPFAPK